MREMLHDLRTKLTAAERSHDEAVHKLHSVEFAKKTLQNQ